MSVFFFFFFRAAIPFPQVKLCPDERGGARKLAWMSEALIFGNWHRETKNSWGIGFCQTISCHLQTLGLKQVVYFHPTVTSNVEVRLESTDWASSGHVTACKALSGASRCWLLPCNNNSAFSSQPLVNRAFRASQQGITHRFVYNPQNNTLVHCQRLPWSLWLGWWLSLVHIFVTETFGWIRSNGRMTVYDWTHSVRPVDLAHPQFLSSTYQIPASVIDENKANLSLLLSPGDSYHLATHLSVSQWYPNHLCLTVVPQTYLLVLFLIFF